MRGLSYHEVEVLIDAEAPAPFPGEENGVPMPPGCQRAAASLLRRGCVFVERNCGAYYMLGITARGRIALTIWRSQVVQFGT